VAQQQGLTSGSKKLNSRGLTSELSNAELDIRSLVAGELDIRAQQQGLDIRA
jgi:hypothetical protein